MDRDALICRATEPGHQNPYSLSDEQLESWMAETEVSQDIYRRLDDDVARDLAPGGRYHGK
jgi:hypothetical protein